MDLTSVPFLGPLSEISSDLLNRLTEENQELHKIDSPHLSLSKTFILKYHWIDNFFSSLREKLKDKSQSCQLHLSSEIVFFSNEEKTRHFACIAVDESCHEILAAIVKDVDSCLNEFKLPTYYKEPSFHVSVLWKLNEFTKSEKTKISSEVGKLFEFQAFEAEKISFKTGNKSMDICL